MNATQDRAVAAFKTFKPRKSAEYVAYAGKWLDDALYEIWYLDEDEYCISFVAFRPNGTNYFVESISELLDRIRNDEHRAEIELQILKERRIRLWVGSAAFLVSLIAMLILLFMQKSALQFTSIVTLVGGVVASGATFIFGIWVPANSKSSKAKVVAEDDPKP